MENVCQDFSFYVTMILGDAEGAGAAGAGAAPGAKPPELTPLQRILQSPLILIVGLFLIYYMTMIQPERRRRAEEERLMSSLKKNDRVVTIGGIHGVVVDASKESSVVTIRIDENSNTRMKVNRTAISKVHDPNEKKNSASKEKEQDTKDSQGVS